MAEIIRQKKNRYILRFGLSLNSLIVLVRTCILVIYPRKYFLPDVCDARLISAYLKIFIHIHIVHLNTKIFICRNIVQLHKKGKERDVSIMEIFKISGKEQTMNKERKD